VSDTSKRHWRDRAPAMLRESFTGPRGEPCFTALDRRWLWHLELTLSTRATTDMQREILRDLRQYLHETCEHHYGDDWPGDDVIPAHRQCLWCNDVVWLDGPAGGEDM
jgi:hypothetical protein